MALPDNRDQDREVEAELGAVRGALGAAVRAGEGLAGLTAAVAEALGLGLAVVSDLDLSVPLQLVSPSLLPKERELLRRPAGDCTALLQRVFEALASLSVRDPLTGLFNRRYFEHRLNQELQRSRRERRPLAMMLVDVDDFKSINDGLGHDVGDRVLCELSSILQRSLRVSDESARLGGDEFALILPNTDLDNAVNIVGARLLEAVSSAAHDGTAGAQLSISVGATAFDPARPRDLAELFKQADLALYAAKEAGKNAVRGFCEAAIDGGISEAEREALLG